MYYMHGYRQNQPHALINYTIILVNTLMYDPISCFNKLYYYFSKYANDIIEIVYVYKL